MRVNGKTNHQPHSEHVSKTPLPHETNGVAKYMDRQTMIKLIQTLPAQAPRTRALEVELRVGVGFGSAWYSSQKEHWTRWLVEYDTMGVYGRRPNSGRDVRAIYNRLSCAPMALWLAEAVGVPDGLLSGAHAAAIAAPANGASQCAAVRKIVPWEIIQREIF